MTDGGNNKDGFHLRSLTYPDTVLFTRGKIQGRRMDTLIDYGGNGQQVQQARLEQKNGIEGEGMDKDGTINQWLPYTT